ncbi:hypothetical protein AVEN_167918-1 [Araneus ventricosus]|uniref:Uncharacterized protein n=1 Tax=Araneus ventricosus TaxID=182803 RepID=A0A4Y2G0M5_ARAVE|nr:hypothetical protein AVEN_167918-1 [Araneus ventricosus]
MDVVAASFELSDPLTHVAFTHGSSSVNFRNLPVNVCSRQVSCRQKTYHRPYLSRGGRFDNLEHFKDTKQTVQVTDTAATEHSCSQGMPGQDASTRCSARAPPVSVYNRTALT